MFNIDEKHFMPCEPSGTFPPEKPRYTMTEEVEHTAREMRNTIERLLKFEKRVESKFEDLMKHLTSDNVLFKNTFAEAYNTFLMEVKNEVNTFEGNMSSSMSLFKSMLQSDYATLSEDCRTQITEAYNNFKTDLNAYKEELNATYDNFRDAIESRLSQYNSNYVESFNTFASQINAKLSNMEKSFNQKYSDFVNQVNTFKNTFVSEWTNYTDSIASRLDGQDSMINDAVLYMKTNIIGAVDSIVAEMRNNGDFAELIESQVFSDFNHRLHKIESTARNTPEYYGAVGDGVTNDTVAIQLAIDACNASDTLILSNKTYCIDAPLTINKKLNIEGNNCTIKATTEMESVMIMTGQSSLNPVSVNKVNVDANNLATFGFKVGGDIDATQITFNECSAVKAKTHGFYIVPVAYCIYFNRCRAMYNGQDGFNAVGLSGDKQMNAICYYGCTAQLNGKNGIHTHGMNHVVTECNSERNEHGIKIGGVNYPAYNMVIRGCYLEENTVNQIYINPLVYCIVAIHDNFLYSTKIDPDTDKVTHVKCVGGDYQLRIDYRRNTTYGENVLEIDGGTTIDYTSRVDTANVQNMRTCKIEEPINSGVRHYLPVTLSAGTPFEKGYTYKSVNMVDDASKNIIIMLPFNVYNSVFRQVGFTAETDGTNAKVNVRVSVYSPDRTLIKGTNFNFTLNGSDDYVENCMNNMLWYNIPNDCYVEVCYVLTDAGDATSVVLSNLFIDVFN